MSGKNMSDINPKQILLDLLCGIQRFQTEKFPEQKELFGKLAKGQCPQTLFITCADSRINPELLTDQSPGNLFVLRNIGNIVPAYGNAMGGVTSAIEYAVSALKVSTIIICGHSNCGAMQALMHPEKTDSMPAVKHWLRFADTAHAITDALEASDVGPEKIQTLTENNILLQLNHLRTHPAVAAALTRNQIALQGWYYDIPNGQVHVLNEETRHDMTASEAIDLLNNQINRTQS